MFNFKSGFVRFIFLIKMENIKIDARTSLKSNVSSEQITKSMYLMCDQGKMFITIRKLM